MDAVDSREIGKLLVRPAKSYKWTRLEPGQCMAFMVLMFSNLRCDIEHDVVIPKI
jgi:hypothetical protein